MIDPQAVLAAVESAYSCLESCRDELNRLNIFPVPDGDTGSNMCLTFSAGLEKIRQREYERADEMIADFSLACFMGARGNSGVILALIIKGFGCNSCEGVSACEYIAKSLKSAVELCYESVASPKEGTALTVLRACSDKANKPSVLTLGAKKFLHEISLTAAATVQKTKELLPELKSANVVDAGAKGLACIFDGLYRAADGNNAYSRRSAVGKVFAADEKVDIKHKFCCEFIIKGESAVPASEMEALGDSVISVFSGGLIKLHFHSNYPDRALALAMSKGELINVKIENMEFGHSSQI